MTPTLAATAGTAPSAPIEARDLYRFFHAGDEERLALRGVSLTVHAGELVAIRGPSGSGKSTLLNLLAGLDEPDGGSVWVAGRRMSRRSEAERARTRASSIGVLLQSANLVEHLTIGDNVALARTLGSRSRRWRLRGRAEGERVKLVLRDVGLDDRARAFPSQLSGGEAVRAGLAVALANDPPVIVADEPTSEVDRATESGLLQLLQARTSAGTAIVVATHSDEVAAAADRVIVLADGAIVG